jgi:hypothetical protein
MGWIHRIKRVLGLGYYTITEYCIAEETLWNVFNVVPKRVLRYPEPILIWTAYDSWEEPYQQYAYLKSRMIKDGSTVIRIEDTLFDYNDRGCHYLIVPKKECGRYKCRSLLISPKQAISRLQRLYDIATNTT